MQLPVCNHREPCPYEGEHKCNHPHVGDYVSDNTCLACPVPSDLEVAEAEGSETFEEVVKEFWPTCDQRELKKTSSCCTAAFCSNPNSDQHTLRVLRHVCEQCHVRVT